ncbi:glutaredoxin family protein [Shimia sp.]|uniref:glutaredoxin family protein n=1 Tax=Shimia sp. TaxID=1954381 RepID=UPI003BAD3214
MSNPLTVYGYDNGCPACDDLKQLLTLLSIPFDFIAVAPDSRERAVLREAGYETVPQVFTPSGVSVGGLSDFRKVARLGLQAGGLLG